jgi:hypothetical protein
MFAARLTFIYWILACASMTENETPSFWDCTSEPRIYTDLNNGWIPAITQRHKYQYDVDVIE